MKKQLAAASSDTLTHLTSDTLDYTSIGLGTLAVGSALALSIVAPTAVSSAVLARTAYFAGGMIVGTAVSHVGNKVLEKE